MEIATRRQDGTLELAISGRLDAYWADHLAAALEDALRAGADRIRVDMSAVSFMSSVGIRVLLRFYKQMQQIQGSFAVANPSEPVKSVLELAGLESLLMTGARTAAASTPQASLRRLDSDTASFRVEDRVPGARLRCRALGDPGLLESGRFGEPRCRTVAFPADTIGVGVGAFGRGLDDCRGRFGEFLAAGGAATYLPTDGTNVADSLVSQAAFVPAVEVLYGLACSGTFAHLVRFEGLQGATVTLTALAEKCLEVGDAQAVGIVVVAESAGLVGAALRRSPAAESPAAAIFEHPGVREWLSFTSERCFVRNLALVVGVAARAEHPALTPLLRPLGAGPWPAAHLHAAAFPYRPLQKQDLDLRATVSQLFETESVQGVLHLLTDDREVNGAGQSEFVRGACWVGPIGEIEAERAS